MKINYHFEEIETFLIDKKLEASLKLAIVDAKMKQGELNFIFCSDDYLLKMNTDYLKHDYYTDIITFDYSESNLISGDIFISKDRVEDNAKQFNVSFENELNRVMIHGILHLLGYKDSSEEEKEIMRAKENDYII